MSGETRELMVKLDEHIAAGGKNPLRPTAAPVVAADEELDAAMDAWTAARARVDQAQRKLRNARILDALACLPPLETLTAEELGERIADHAREHRPGETDEHWQLMRATIAELVRRAGGLDSRFAPAAWTEVGAQLIRIGDVEGEIVDDARPAELVFHVTRAACAKVGRAGHLATRVSVAIRRAS